MATHSDELRSFPNTSWTLALKAGNAAAPEIKQKAMAELVARYRPAFLKHLVVTRRLDINDAEDLTQEFITTRILERNLIAHAEQSRGKLRSFLVKALQNFVEDWRRSRGRRNAAAQLQEEWDGAPPAEADEYDLEWARLVLGATFDRMKAECREKGQSHIWQVFFARVVTPIVDAAPVPTYEEMVRKYGFQSPKEANNLFVTAKRMFVRFLNEVIGDYVSEENIADEIHDLKRILSNAGPGADLARVLAVGMGDRPVWTCDEAAALNLNESDDATEP